MDMFWLFLSVLFVVLIFFIVVFVLIEVDKNVIVECIKLVGDVYLVGSELV